MNISFVMLLFSDQISGGGKGLGGGGGKLPQRAPSAPCGRKPDFNLRSLAFSIFTVPAKLYQIAYVGKLINVHFILGPVYTKTNTQRIAIYPGKFKFIPVKISPDLGR